MTQQPHAQRLEEAHRLFLGEFGNPMPEAEFLAIHAPGRSEIAGNHTDHEGGCVIAGALDVAVDGVAVANGTNVVRLASEGYDTIEVTLDCLEPQTNELNTTASLVRGMASALASTGRTPSGFDMAIVCDVPAGGGLSSSAAVEAAIGRAMEALWEGPSIPALDLARMCQHAENAFFGKPCGLMDQASVCLGGLAFIDFADPADPMAKKLDFDFDAAGYGLVLVKVGSSHENLTSEYAAIPGEMQAVAAELGHERLCDVDEKSFDVRVPELRSKFGDRALLRSIHYWREDKLVRQRWDALAAKNIETFLSCTRESGASSAMFLQNVAVPGNCAQQAAMLALGLAEHQLDGLGATRIHGGGFGGTIQCFVPLEHLDAFCAQMDSWLGEGSSRHYRIAPEGAFATWL